MNNNQQQTPLERLRADKARLEGACRKQEQKLGETWGVIRENAGSLLLSGFSSLLFPGSKSKNKAEEKTTPSTKNPTAATPPVSFGVSDGIALAKTLMPVAWEIVQPLLVNWSIKKARKMLARLFSSKKKAA